MATRIVSMRILCPMFQPVLTLRCHGVNIKRYVRKRICVSGLMSVKDSIENSKQVVSQNEHLLQDNIFRNNKKDSIHRPDNISDTVLAREDVINADHCDNPQHTTLSRFGEVDGLLYEKAQPGDKIVTRLVNIARSKKLREQQGKVVLEGKHLIRSALDSGAIAQTVYFSSVDALQELPLDRLRRTSIVKVRMDDPKIWSDLDISKNLIAIFRRPEASHLTFSEEKYGKPVPLTLICDNVRDPGNLAAVLRSAAAAGCHSVLLTKGCVDVWEPKVLRAAMGAHFRLPVIPNLTWSDIPSHLPKTVTIHVADNCSTTLTEDNNTIIPQQQKKPSDYGWVRGHQYPKKVKYEDDDFCGFEDYDGGKSLETQCYYIDWVARHTGLVIGGESHGLSREALRLAESTGGRRLLIPMVCGVDSLNSAMAANILLFEGRKQLLSLAEKIRS
ncbi:rRNA methyltransferase 3B, mitochondrial isoform X1 [Carassius auratus]|uniref:rRNA methyltransferase 3B, mitochondrial isoform X1 n=1 Tax=Carassius auratus TaxID=7957 RepID=A0A6P6IV18_CARAU|nr:rRNA methyltransferase 3B, mitochondrial-like isoform X1 [Carassius auratus]